MKYHITITVDNREQVYTEVLFGNNNQSPIVRATTVVAEILESFADFSELTDHRIEVLFVKTATNRFGS